MQIQGKGKEIPPLGGWMAKNLRLPLISCSHQNHHHHHLQKGATMVSEAQYYLVQGTQYHVLAPLMSALALPLPIPADTSGAITHHWRITRKSQAPFLLTIHATDISATPHLVSSLSKDFKVIALGTLFLAPVTATSGLRFVQGLWARIWGC